MTAKNNAYYFAIFGRFIAAGIAAALCGQTLAYADVATPVTAAPVISDSVLGLPAPIDSATAPANPANADPTAAGPAIPTPIIATPAIAPPQAPPLAQSQTPALPVTPSQPVIAAMPIPTMPAPAAPVSIPATATATQAPLAVATTPVAAGVLPAISRGNDIAQHNNETIPKSMFLSQDDYVRISNAIADYQKLLASRNAPPVNQPPALSDNNGNIKDMDKQLDAAPKAPVETSFTYPQYYLQSLVYHSPSDWLVQINGKKITPQNVSTQVDIKVAAIDKEKLLVKWKPINMNRVNDVWEKMPASDKTISVGKDTGAVQITFSESTVLDRVPNVPVMVDNDDRTVTFVLRPNQTFSSYAMRVVEGKIEPVTIQIGPRAATDVKKATEKKLGEPIDDSDSGLNGLMKTLEKQQKAQEKP